MGAIDELLEWAVGEGGVILNGVSGKAIPGRGVGIVATRALKVCCAVLLRVSFYKDQPLLTRWLGR